MFTAPSANEAGPEGSVECCVCNHQNPASYVVCARACLNTNGITCLPCVLRMYVENNTDGNDAVRPPPSSVLFC